ncbi:hypothetical protein SDC9_127502 [bioreactor metagenome]|uniref:Uncharacterized protein n=1 Tax=bioreactor metagenome TaxID=1076179 RepID=A0A645CU91_9ZZZZ
MPVRTSSAWSRTTARRAISWRPPTPSSRTTASVSARICGPTPARASRSVLSRPILISTRPASWSRRCANWCAMAYRRRRLRCSTARTPSRASLKTSCSPRMCRTRFTAACASSSGRKSSTRWLTCACWAIRTTTRLSCASSISRLAASAPVRWKTSRPRRTR